MLNKIKPYHYISCTTSTFLGGRTETIRSATPESFEFVMEMLDCLVEDDSRRRSLLVRAIEKHAKLSQEAFSGQGFDRHMFVMKKLAGWRGDRVPNALLFGNIYSNVLNKNILSTSTVMNDFVDQASFGPVKRII